MRISWIGFTRFGIDYWVAKENGTPQRLGQMFLNERFPGVTDPELFYEDNDAKAWQLIMNRYVREGYADNQVLEEGYHE